MSKKRKRKSQQPSPNELFLFSSEEMTDMLALSEEAKPDTSTSPPAAPRREPDQPIEPTRKEEPVMDEQPILTTPMVDTDDMASTMVAAMNLLDQLYSPSQVRLIAMECAARAQSGISDDKVYELPALPGRKFTSRQFTALYYVSFARSFPSMIDRINLPLESDYSAALEKYDSVI